jgi:transmembrane sensor
MKSLNYKKVEAFVFRLWYREVSGEKISQKETEILEKWKFQVGKDLDVNQINESKQKILLSLEPYFIQSKNINQKSTSGKYWYQAAAVLLFLISLGGIFTYHTYFKPDVYVADLGNRKIHLADGSTVTLFHGAELTVEKSFPADTRIVALKGDAIFAVAKSKIHPFIVNADGFKTKVLGTVFKISQSGNDKAVDLYEGKVAVSSEGVPVYFLKPNQKWTNFGLPRTAAVLSISPENNSGQKLSTLMSLSFNDVSLKEVVGVLQKNHQISIKYPKEVSDKKITANFTGGTTDENIDALAFILGLEVKKENQIYILK